MSIIRTGKYLSSENNKSALSLHQLATGVTSGMVVIDRVSPLPEGVKYPRTDGQIYSKRMYDFVNKAAVEFGLPAAEEFIDEDGDEAINNYGVDFATGEILGWDRHAE